MAYGQGPLEHGTLYRFYDGALVDIYDFQYNPNLITHKLDNNWHYTASPGQYMPVASFQKYGKQTITFELFLFGRENKEGLGAATYIKREVARLKLFATPGPVFSKTNSRFISPGRVKLIYGDTVENGVVDKLSVSHSMFDRNMDPIDATVSLSLTLVSAGSNEEILYADLLRARGGITGGTL